MILERLARRQGVGRRVALVVAHPDDETIAAGGSLHLFPDLLLIHVTDGAPHGLDDAGREGFASSGAYARARAAELDAALQVAGVRPLRAELGMEDQLASLAMDTLAADLVPLLARHGTEAVLTHAYEGGHPDHDATCFAVHRAAARLGIGVLEFAGYHAGDDGMQTQQFLPGPAETMVMLDEADAVRKQAMLDCFRTQRAILSAFTPSVERFRPAPGYDFTQPPHPGVLNYENWGWEMTGARWRALAGRALVQEGVPCAA